MPQRDLSTADLAAVEPERREATDPTAAAESTDARTVNEDTGATTRATNGGPANHQPEPGAGDLESLIPEDQGVEYRRRWEEIQVRFVDEPRGSVEQADQLVANVIAQLADTFASERKSLEQQWGRGDEVSTEDLRVALQRYRSFFTRLLAA
jgi:hypothetical protein